MSLVALGGDDAARPTYFELVAAQGLVPSIKATLIYSLSVYSQRWPRLHTILRYEDEAFALLSLLLEQQSLWYCDATLAESLYSLKRTCYPASLGSKSTAIPASGSSGSQTDDLQASDRWQALLLTVAAPYIRSKLEALYLQWRPPEHAMQDLLPPTTVQSTPVPPNSYTPQSSATHPPTVQSGTMAHGSTALSLHGSANMLQDWQLHARKAYVMLYPWLHAAIHGCGLVYQLGYLVGLTEYWTPVLALLRQRVERLSAHELIQQQQALQRKRAQELQNAGRPGSLVGNMRRGWVRARQLLADNTRTVVISAVFMYKLLEWWYTSAEQQLAAQRKLPPPPPPPEPAPHPQGLILPWDVTLCPLCCKPRTNPAMLVVSGYVFCYPCLHKYLEVEQRCPITWRPANGNHVRRLYQDA